MTINGGNMIYDHVKNIEKYRELGPGFSQGIDFLLAKMSQPIKPGRYEISEAVYAQVNVYETKAPEEAFIEAHHEHIDFQFMLEGDEDVVWAPVQFLEHGEELPEQDLYKFNGAGNRFPLEKDYFMILFPTDAHMPSLTRNGMKRKNKKLILKIKVKDSLL